MCTNLESPVILGNCLSKVDPFPLSCVNKSFTITTTIKYNLVDVHLDMQCCHLPVIALRNKEQ